MELSISSSAEESLKFTSGRGRISSAPASRCNYSHTIRDSKERTDTEVNNTPQTNSSGKNRDKRYSSLPAEASDHYQMVEEHNSSEMQFLSQSLCCKMTSILAPGSASKVHDRVDEELPIMIQFTEWRHISLLTVSTRYANKMLKSECKSNAASPACFC